MTNPNEIEAADRYNFDASDVPYYADAATHDAKALEAVARAWCDLHDDDPDFLVYGQRLKADLSRTLTCPLVPRWQFEADKLLHMIDEYRRLAAASAPSPSAGRVDREAVAERVFDAMAWGAKYSLGFAGHKWVKGGNSLAEDEARRTADAILALLDRSEGEEAWTCAARRSMLPEPQDCDWPSCGCDPKATDVLDSLKESGYELVNAFTAEYTLRSPSPATREDRLREAIKSGRELDAEDGGYPTPSECMAQARNEGRLAGLEEAAGVADNNRTDDDSMWDRAAVTIASAIRALSTDSAKEGK